MWQVLDQPSSWIWVLIVVSVLFYPASTSSAAIGTQRDQIFHLTADCSPQSGTSEPSAVWIYIPQSQSQSTDNINFFICNGSAHTIVIETVCYPFELQKEQFVWLPKKLPCADETLQLWQIAPHQNLHIALIPKGDASSASNIVASAPVSPIIYQGDLRDLPPPPTPKPGDPVREVPRGGVPPVDTNSSTQMGEYTFMSLPINLLEPGNYRLVVRYTFLDNSGDEAAHTTYSERFTVFAQ